MGEGLHFRTAGSSDRPLMSKQGEKLASKSGQMVKWAKTTIGSAALDGDPWKITITLTSEFSFCFQCEVGSSLVLGRPLESTPLIIGGLVWYIALARSVRTDSSTALIVRVGFRGGSAAALRKMCREKAATSRPADRSESSCRPGVLLGSSGAVLGRGARF